MFFKKPKPPAAPSCSLDEVAKDPAYEARELWPASIEHRRASATIPEQMQETLLSAARHVREGKDEFETRRLSRLYAGEYYEIPSVLLVTLPETIMHVPSGIAFTPQGTALVGSTPTFDPSVLRQVPSDLSSLPCLSGDFLSLCSLWGTNYAHWLMDTLPRLSALDHCPAGTRLLLRGTLGGFQTGSLELLGVPTSRFEFTSDSFVRLERLHVLRCGAVTGVPHRGPLSWLRSRMRSAVQAEDQPTGPGLFISRSQTTTRSKTLRNILNEAELLAIASRQGVEPILPEKLPFLEQVTAFSRCSAVVGPHGAGIYNFLFAPQGVPVVELYNWSYWEHAACRMSSLLGMPHYHLFSQSVGKEGNFSVDTGRFSKLLQNALCPQEPIPEKIF